MPGGFVTPPWQKEFMGLVGGRYLEPFYDFEVGHKAFECTRQEYVKPKGLRWAIKHYSAVMIKWNREIFSKVVLGELKRLDAKFGIKAVRCTACGKERD